MLSPNLNWEVELPHSGHLSMTCPQRSFVGALTLMSLLAQKISIGTQNAVFASDWYLVPMQPDFLSSVGLSLLQDRLGYLRKSLEFKLRCLGIVFSRVRRHINVLVI